MTKVDVPTASAYDALLAERDKQHRRAETMHGIMEKIKDVYDFADKNPILKAGLLAAFVIIANFSPVVGIAFGVSVVMGLPITYGIAEYSRMMAEKKLAACNESLESIYGADRTAMAPTRGILNELAAASLVAKGLREQLDGAAFSASGNELAAAERMAKGLREQLDGAAFSASGKPTVTRPPRS